MKSTNVASSVNQDWEEELSSLPLDEVKRVADEDSDPERRKKAKDWWVIRTRCFGE